MTQSSSQNQVAQLQACLSAARDIANHEESSQKFAKLKEQVATENPAIADMLDTMWNEVLSARRSAAFWQEVSNIEKQLSERIAANHVQLRQNYQRLMQEQ